MGKRPVRPGNWLITYSDFITLLLIFFIVLYVLTPDVDKTVLRSILSPFKGGTGILTESTMIPPDQLPDRRRMEEEWQEFSEYIEEQGLQDEVQIDLMEEGNRIILRESLTFQSGRADLMEAGQAVLEQITYLFDQSVSEIEVQGHTDNVPVAAHADIESNWELGSDRAASVARYLMNITDVPPERFKIASHGEYRPVATNQTEEGRRANRRVEIYVRYNDDPQSLEPGSFSRELGLPEFPSPSVEVPE